MINEKVLLDDTQSGVVDRVRLNLQLFASDKERQDDDDMNEEWSYDPDEDPDEESDEESDESTEEMDNTVDNTETPDEEDPEKKPYRQTREDNKNFAKARKENARLKLAAFEKENAELKEKLAQVETKNASQSIYDQITDQMVWERADKEGISESVAKRLLYFEIKEKREEQAKLISQKTNEVKTKPYFKEVEEEFNTWLKNDPNLDPIGVYNYLVGANIDKLRSGAEKNATKRTVADIHDQSRRSLITKSVGGGGDDTVDYSSKLSRAGMDMALAFGNDPKEIAKYAIKNLKKRR